MSVVTIATFLFFLIFSPLLSLGSALPCPECDEMGNPPPPVIITEPCDECEHMHMPTPAPVIVTEPCDECEHMHMTSDVLTETVSVCRHPTTTKKITHFTSGTHTYLMSSCHPSTIVYTHNITGEECAPARTETATSILTTIVYRSGTGGVVGPVQTAYPMNATTITITKPVTAPVEISTSIERITETSYASGPAPATVTQLTTSTQLITTTTEQIVPTRVLVTRFVTRTSTMFSTITQSATTEHVTQTRYLSGKPPATVTQVSTKIQISTSTTTQVSTTRIRAAVRYVTLPASTQLITETSYMSGTPPATVTQVTTKIQTATTREVVSTTQKITTTQRITLTSYLSGKSPATITELTTRIETSEVPTTVLRTIRTTIIKPASTERITATSYLSGSPPATVTEVSTHIETSEIPTTVFRTTRITSTKLSTIPATAAGEAVTSVSTVIRLRTITAPGQTIISTVNVTHTTQLPAGTSTVTKGTQTLTTTLSIATETFTKTQRPPVVTRISTLPASTHVITTTPPAQTRTITDTATIGSDVLVTKTVTETPATLPARISTRTITRTVTASFFTTDVVTSITTVTRTPAAATRTEILTTTEEAGCTASTISVTRVRTVTSTDLGPPQGYCTPSTVTKTLPRATTQATVTVTDNGPPPGGYDSTKTITKTKTVIQTSTAPCNKPVRTPVANCKVPTGQFRISIQDFGDAYLTATSGKAKPNGDHETLGWTSVASQALFFNAVSNGQTTFVTTNSLTLYSDQQDSSSGNGPIFWDSLDAIQGYGDGEQAVQFCLQNDNTFVVQNPTDGATSVFMCAGVIYLLSADNAATSTCTPVTLVKS